MDHPPITKSLAAAALVLQPCATEEGRSLIHDAITGVTPATHTGKGSSGVVGHWGMLPGPSWYKGDMVAHLPGVLKA